MHPSTLPATPAPAVTPRHALLENLIAAATSLARAQLRELCVRLAGALVDGDTMQDDIRDVQLRLRAGNLLRDRQGLFVQLASDGLERHLRRGLAQLAPRQAGPRDAEALALVPYEEMDQQVTLGGVARPFEAAHADALAALGARLAHLLERGTLRPGQNPFRPDVFIASLQEAWAALHAEPEAAGLLLPLLKAGLFYDLAPILEALNLALARHGVLPGVAATARARQDTHDAAPRRRDAQLVAQLRGLFAASATGPALCDELGDLDLSLPQLTAVAGANRAAQAAGHAAAPSAERPLLAYLARLKEGGTQPASNVIHLPSIKAQAPRGSLSRADESTIDLLAAVFDTVYGDQAIAGEIRDLIRLLQLPVLKTALHDKAFFFDDDHPARRLLDLLSHLGWEQSQKGRQDPDDPLVRAMRRSVDRIGDDDAQQPATFAQAVTELEASLREEEAATTAALAGPVAAALRQEQRDTAVRAARAVVAARLEVGEGSEVAAVVVAFLQQQWTDVLALAHDIEDDKPGAVANATAAMDELLWSVRPKSGADERRQLIKRLPGLLAALNRWLDVIDWQDAGRLRFFADLAECHASIVRAPLDLAPARRLELSVQATRQAAAQAAAPQPADDAVHAVDALVRGAWLEFDTAGSPRRVKLAWISPLRSLYIFSNGAREEAFSLSADELAQRFRAGAAAVLPTGDLVARALTQAIGTLAVNDDDGASRAA
ncbi:DUF1631 family protein [Pseudoduganella buxea]|uniref:DUF1631 family protein n=2 Tax=Pseudoduganella buxea TaxID=1949069 RepID=A0ABQ1K4N2_9BURK|nr:DUF1631 family protein [Pseudoduganella buxea]GGB86455.1 hypothetical protein GCM10011572_05530 [Pseudoduganella buxea]